MTPKRKSSRKAIHKTKRTTSVASKYVLDATFKLRSAPITKSEAETKANRIRANGGIAVIKKV